MNTAQFINIKKTMRKAKFSELIGLKESGNTSELLDFCTRMHPNAEKQAQESKCAVFPGTGEHYIYTIYNNAIVRTAVYKGIKHIYTI